MACMVTGSSSLTSDDEKKKNGGLGRVHDPTQRVLAVSQIRKQLQMQGVAKRQQCNVRNGNSFIAGAQKTGLGWTTASGHVRESSNEVGGSRTPVDVFVPSPGRDDNLDSGDHCEPRRRGERKSGGLFKSGQGSVQFFDVTSAEAFFAARPGPLSPPFARLLCDTAVL
ncbi:hypothetical protein MCOR29_003032 [Pyricularia oryzae]|nr:hypothetical protein MCOR29_003032 [Pyricularia oryzae]KAI6568399.1 hypothetical protein MCOR09_005799 [Pyricularia oryzae]KAI6635758.1 hypothetical protein MCOR14_005618 [Pyricularia oryzae]